MLRFSTLRGKLITLFLLFALVPFFVVAYFGLTRFENALLEREIVNGKNLTRSVANTIEAILRNNLVQIKILAQELGFLTSTEEANRLLADFENTNLLIASVSLTDTNGIQIADSQGKGIGEDKSDTEWFKASGVEKKLFLSDVRMSQDLGVYILNLSAPVYDPQGTFRGVVTARLNLEELYRQLSEGVQVQKTGYLYLYDVKNERVTLHPDQTLLGKSFRDVDANLSFIDEALKGEKEAEIHYTYKGAERIVFFQSLKPSGLFSGENFKDWRIAAVAPIGELRAPVIDMFRFILILAAVAVAVIVFFAFQIGSSLANPIRKTAEALSQVAQGNLRVTVAEYRGKDEIGMMVRSLQTMLANLRDLVGKALNASSQLAASSEELTSPVQEVSKATQEIARTMAQVAEGSTRQGEDLNRNTESIEKLAREAEQVENITERNLRLLIGMEESLKRNTEAVRRIQEAVNTTNDNTRRTQEEALRGKELLMGLVERVNTMASVAQEIGESISVLESRSQEIGKIVDLITGIAEQTNLLALNAAIEAARAGEAGRGFAVVAEEVRKLAENSAQAAGQIAHLIGEIQKDTEKAVKNAERASTEVTEGTKESKEVEGKFLEILSAIEGVSRSTQNLVDALRVVEKIQEETQQNEQELKASSEEITRAAKIMAERIKEIAERVSSIAAVAEENAASSEEVSASTEEQSASLEEINSATESLAKLAEELQKTVSVFQI
ncbi:MAG: methyl-accepting chemotaxis protein [Candidatus Atribacteria bacterium]|nr:methyl-accepting chemotaxis protein [Candidatus Atribacteria bacterium]